eukprot:1675843-Rhodomonas_salina.1
MAVLPSGSLFSQTLTPGCTALLRARWVRWSHRRGTRGKEERRLRAFVEDVAEESPDAERRQREITRRVDYERLFTFVKVKTERSDRGRRFILFLLFITFYIGKASPFRAAIIMQSNPYNTQSMVQAFKDHFTEATYRDIASFELKTFEDTVTE